MPPGILERIESKLDQLLEKKGGSAAAEDDDADEAKDEEEAEEKPKGRTRTRTPNKPAGGKALTMVEVKAKIKSVLDKKGRKTAVALLEEFDVEKVGDLEEDQFAKFVKACDKALGGDEDDDDL